MSELKKSNTHQRYNLNSVFTLKGDNHQINDFFCNSTKPFKLYTILIFNLNSNLIISHIIITMNKFMHRIVLSLNVHLSTKNVRTKNHLDSSFEDLFHHLFKFKYNIHSSSFLL